MEDEEARKKIAELAYRVLAQRDVVARLLAYETARWPNQTQLLEDFSSAPLKRLRTLDKGREPSASAIWGEEIMQREIDWIVAAARMMAAEGD
jgi:hypothetical protein